MKKIVGLYLLMFISIFSQSNVPEFKAFEQAKQSYLNGDYDKAKLEFDNFSANYKNTKLFNSHYPNYFIGMNYYKIGNLKLALKYLDSSIYHPKYMVLVDSKKTNYFEFERAYQLGQIYSQLGYHTNAQYQYLSLIKNYYTPNLEKYEKRALNILASKNPYYNYILEAKYQHNFTNISKLKELDLKRVSEYLYSKGEFLDFYKAYKDTPNSSMVNKDVVISTLNILEDSEQYDFMIELIKKQEASNNMDTDYFYYWGNALKKLKRPSEAIEKYKKVTQSPYIEKAYYSIGRTYFVQKDYDNSIIWAKKLIGDKSHELLTRSYFNSGQIEEFKKSAIEYIKNYPNSDLAGYYRNMLYNESKNPNYLKWIIKHNLNSYYYQVAYNITKDTRTLEEYPLAYKTRLYKDTLVPLNEISNLNDPQLLIIKFDDVNFPKDKVFEQYIKTIYLEKLGLYDLAMQSSLSQEVGFSSYSNLYPYLYPRYYGSIIAEFSKKYDVEEPLIYAIIKESSEFNKNLIYKSTHFGLMQLDLKTARQYSPNITAKELLNPRVNIELGVEHLAHLLSVFDNNNSKTIAGYNAGETIIQDWNLDANGDIDVEQIPYFNSQEFIKKTIANYYKYKNLYKN